MKNMSPKDVNTYFQIIAGIGLVFMVGGSFNVRFALPCIIVGGLFAVAALIFHAVFYRCPHCGRPLGRAAGEYCPHCGKPLNE